MRKMKLKMLLLPVLLVLGALNLAAGNAHGFDNYRFPDGRLRVVPQPQEYQLTQGVLALPAQFSVQIPPGEEVIAEVLQTPLKRFQITVAQAADSAFCRFITTNQGVPESVEGYKLEITSKEITVSARGNAGLFYGAQTLANLLANAAEPKLECCVINDYPSFPLRGYTIRMVKCNEGVKNLVKTLASLKYNCLLLNINEYFPFNNPDVKKHARAIPESELRELAALCKKYHLAAVPRIQLFSHAQWLMQHKDWEKITEGVPRRKSSRMLWHSQPCPQNAQARQAELQNLLQYLDIFNPDIMYVCMDEIYFGPFKSCPLCKNEDAVKLLDDYLNYMRNGIKKAGYNCKLAFCHDCLINKAIWPYGEAWRKKSMTKDDLIVWWTYKAEPNVHEVEPIFRDKLPFVAKGLPGSPANIHKLADVVRQYHGQGVFMAHWYFSITNIMDEFQRRETPDSMGGICHSGEYLWNLRSEHHADFTYDGTYESMRRLHPDQVICEVKPPKFNPIPLNHLVNAELSGTGGKFPGLTDEMTAEINRVLAVQPEKYQILTAPGGKYYGLRFNGAKSQSGRRAAVVPLYNKKLDSLALLTAASIPSNLYKYLSNHKSGKMRFKGPTVMNVRFCYADGTSQIVPLRFRRELTDWNQTFGGFFMRWAVRGEDQNGLFYSFGTTEIKNPKPDQPLKSVNFSTAHYDGISPVILALSAKNLSSPFKNPGKFNPEKISKPYGPETDKLTVLWEKNFLDGKTDGFTILAGGKYQGNVKTEIVPDAVYGKVLKITVPPANRDSDFFVRVDVLVPYHFVKGAGCMSRCVKVLPMANLDHFNEYVLTSAYNDTKAKYEYRMFSGQIVSEAFNHVFNIFSERSIDGTIKEADMPRTQTRKLSFFLRNTTTPTEIYVAHLGLYKEKRSQDCFWSRTTERER